MSNDLKFTIDHYEIEEFDNFLVLKSYIVSVGPNRKKTYFSKDSIEEAIPTLLNRPVYCKWVERIDDFDGHARTNDEIIKEDYVFIGHIPSNGEIGFEKYDGKEFLTATTLIYKDYFPDICDRIVEEQPELSMEVSAEEAFENEDGLLEISKFRFLSYVLLGRYNNPGIENAHVEVLQFDDENLIDEYNVKYSETLPKYKMPDNIVQIIKDNVEKKEVDIDLEFVKGLLRKEQLDFNEVVSFLDKVVNTRSNSETNFLGGEEAINWCKNVIALSEGGKEILAEDKVKKEDENKEEEVQNEDVTQNESEKDDFSVSSTVSLLNQVLDESDGYYFYEDCDPETKEVYYFDYSSWKYYIANYEMSEDGLPVVKFDEARRAYYGGINWVVPKEDDSVNVEDLRDYSAAVKYAVEVVENSVNLSKQLEQTKKKYESLKEDLESVKEERDSLAQFKANVEKEQEDAKLLEEASEVYAIYEGYLDAELLDKFNEDILEYRDIEKLKGEVAKTVVPILMESTSKVTQEDNDINFNMADTLPGDEDGDKPKGFMTRVNEVYKK